MIVQLVAAVLQGIVHVEGDDHAHVHIDELGGEVEVTLQVARIHHVDDDIRGFLDDVLAHVEFLRAVGREGIRTR